MANNTNLNPVGGQLIISDREQSPRLKSQVIEWDHD